MSLKRFEKFVPEDFFEWMSHIYKLKGVAFPKTVRGNIPYLMFATCHISMICCLVVSECYEFFRVFKDDLKQTMFNMSVCIFDCIILLRIGIWFLSEAAITRINDVIRRESFNFDLFSIVKIKRGEGFHRYASTMQEKDELVSYKKFGDIWKQADFIYSVKR